ncbi:MAG TPA: acylphosphatase [Candidatus Binatia bacterium]|nr:acylphosphatase [Candidatus Binatia bacterium]
MAAVRVELRIHGRVQGVFYRASAHRQARVLGLSGYVENLGDGSVGVVAEGDETAIERLIAWCRVGPPSARVSRIDVTRVPASGKFTDFEVR